MQEQTRTLAPFYDGWDNYQRLLIQALAPLTVEQLDLKAAPHLRSAGVIARHIIGARARWLYLVMKEESADLLELGKWDDKDQPARSGEELARGLQGTWQVLHDGLRRWTIADMDEILHDFDEETGIDETHTRQWVIWHLIEHDLHHGGEISFALGMHGLPAIDL
ncbi:DinB family protein [Dictyobacter aurantiacus]|uniref:DinB-like domain-containing protein n=1 Tax=Dictyobacter aurantiacus TaxID=1936993 RepID=A0A401ZKF9_9CHLR|nr:DinB family protein [Dictyobacter aurantiacus]GCE07339.1 hypothetical protein KDAU_46680 [Dictyobacter aurantiacus]